MTKDFSDKLDEEIHQNIKSNWLDVLGNLRDEVGEVAYKSWLTQLSIVGVEENKVLLLSLPSNFLKDWVVQHYGNKIDLICKKYCNDIIKTKVIVDEGKKLKQANLLDSKIKNVIVEETSPLDPRFTFNNFIVGKSNEFAFAAAKRVCESSKVSFNPLFLFGGVGLGKTHLMHAVAWEIREKSPRRKVVYLSAEKFMYEFVRSLRFRDTMSFKEKFRSVDVLMIDDIQFIAGKDSTQEEFFHTFNSLVDQKKQIIISGDRPPSDFDRIEERLRSRLSFGVVGEIHKANYELRLSILLAKSEERKDIKIDRKVIEFLARKISSNVRELEGAYRRLIAHVELINKPITIDTATQLLQDLLRANDKRVTVEEIQRKVAEYFNIRLNDMMSIRRSRVVARPRQIAMYLSKSHTPRSLPEIGRMFGGRDHTTVIHAIKKVEELCRSDSSFAEHISTLKRTLGI